MSSVTVEINGRETVSQAALAAKNGVASLSAEVTKSTSSFSSMTTTTGGTSAAMGGLVVTAGDVVNALQSIARAIAGTVQAYADQQRSVAQFEAAMQLSSSITGEGADALRKYASEIAILTGEDDEAILSMEAFLAASGRNEIQIRKLITVAADYSAATGKGMRTAVEELNKTFSGTEGRMGTLIPALKDLTDAQLKAGAGVDVVAKQYGGFATQMSGIADIQLKNLKNSYDDVLAALGKAVMPALGPAMTQLAAFINDTLIPGIDEAAATLYAVFKNLPEVSRASFEGVIQLIRIAFSWDVLNESFFMLGSFLIDTFKNAFEGIGSMFRNMVELFTIPITALGLYISEVITKAFSGKFKDISSPGALFAGIIEKEAVAIGNVWESAKQVFLNQQNSVTYLFSDFGKQLGTVAGGIRARIDAIIGPDVARALARTGAIASGGSGVGISPTPSGGVGVYSPEGFSGASVTSGGTSSAAMVGEAVAAAAALGYASDLRPGARGFARSAGGEVSGQEGRRTFMEGVGDFAGDLFNQLSGGLGSAIQSLGMFQAILDPIGTILSGAMEVLGPLIETILQPIVGALRVLGQMIAAFWIPQLEIMGPVIKFLAEGFVWLYNNALRYLANGIISVMNILSNSVIGLANGFINAYNAIRWIWGGAAVAALQYRALDQGWLGAITLGTLTTAGASSGTTTTATGTAATYEKPRDITINVQINTAALVGSGGISDFAAIIGRELRSLGVLNMAAT